MNAFSPEHLGALVDKIWALIVDFVPRAVLAVIILIIAVLIAQRVARGLARLIGRTHHVDPSLRFIAAEFVRYTIIVLVLIMALEQIGVRTTSLFAALGAAGLAIGLALQGTLSNIAAGFMLLWLRPFRIGDYIEVNNVPGLAGTVRQIGLFTTSLRHSMGFSCLCRTPASWNVPLRNYSRTGGRLVSLTAIVPNQIDFGKAREALLALADHDKRIVKLPKPEAFVDRVNGDGVVLNFRFWVAPGDIGTVQREILAAGRDTLDALATDAKAPLVQITRVIPPDTDPSRLMDQAGQSLLL